MIRRIEHDTTMLAIIAQQLLTFKSPSQSRSFLNFLKMNKKYTVDCVLLEENFDAYFIKIEQAFKSYNRSCSQILTLKRSAISEH